MNEVKQFASTIHQKDTRLVAGFLVEFLRSLEMLGSIGMLRSTQSDVSPE